ncbi:sulfite exporter TauE/SafE family protein [Paenibacillus hexagrammi]|uniref:Probable membrane transporter protein n=1 Tax=Paenibacillus hexagrammi TaxID=2908839 RepID=A0ABY3SS70_9BACL|nr:sulfite exporter TauE/SafE family protein [Paenibacillus sp. YPD9-1]UJF36410.1 sulfite exporter TauE/SafE family protein [Paenibacillus sp. YPD9-1]
MFIAGLFLGFVGAGGSGFIISILTAIFGFPIHTALGTALAAMLFSSASGTISHYREGNMVWRTGIAIGLFGAAGAWVCTQFAAHIDEHRLQLMTASILYVSAFVLWIRMFLAKRSRELEEVMAVEGVSFWLRAMVIGIICGALSGLFGIGSTPFIQIGLMTLMRMTVSQAAGTTMLVIIPIALSGGVGFYGSGHLDLTVLAEVLIGIMAGSYVGAKFTNRVPSRYLKTAMVVIPVLGATLLLIK